MRRTSGSALHALVFMASAFAASPVSRADAGVDARCEAATDGTAPRVSLTELGGGRARLQWCEVVGAEGYNLFVDRDYRQSFGSETRSAEVDYAPGSDYRIAWYAGGRYPPMSAPARRVGAASGSDPGDDSEQRTARGGDDVPPRFSTVRDMTIRVGDQLNLLVKASDDDSSPPAVTFARFPNGGWIVDTAPGTSTLRWIPGADDVGEHSVEYRAEDAHGGGVQSTATVSVRVVSRDALVRDGERLRDLAARRGLMIGFASVRRIDSRPDRDLYRDIAAAEFNLVTSENSMKMAAIQPERGRFEWQDADAQVAFGLESGMRVHGHPLVWHTQLPGWVYSLPADQVEQVMRDHIVALMSRYRGRVAIWDVVNEALNDDGGFRSTVWQRSLGEGYVRKAFEIARAADPEATLLYNDYDIATPNAKSDALYRLASRERAAGAPIDGIGFQLHVSADFNRFDEVRRNFRRFADLGLDIYITELDVAVGGERDFGRQAEVYRELLRVCLDVPRCRAFQSWGFTDRYSWRRELEPLPFDARYRPKEAYRALQRTLRDYSR